MSRMRSESLVRIDAVKAVDLAEETNEEMMLVTGRELAEPGFVVYAVPLAVPLAAWPFAVCAPFVDMVIRDDA